MDACSKKALKVQYKNRTMVGGVFCIRCIADDAVWLRSTTDIQGSKNRLAFSISTNLCPETCMAQAWKSHGAAAFSFEVLETLEKKEAQSDREFSEDIGVLFELWAEKLNGNR